MSQVYLPLQCFFIDLSHLKDENHWWAGASDYLFCKIGHKMVQYPGSSGIFSDAPKNTRLTTGFWMLADSFLEPKFCMLSLPIYIPVKA